MKENKILLMASVACTLIFASYFDLLDLYPEDSLSDLKLWTSVQDLGFHISGFHGILPGAQGPGADDGSDCYANEKPRAWVLNLETIPASGDGRGGRDWGNIRSCNYFVDHYKHVQGDKEQINRSATMAHFFHAWEYVCKMKRFGDVPWYETELQMDSEQLYKGHDSRKVVFTHILEDLDFVIEHLSKPNETKIGSIHKYAALAFKPGACLYEAPFRKYHGLGDYGELCREAAEAAEQAVEKGGYTVYKTDSPTLDYYDLFAQEDLSSNSKCIMPRVHITKLLIYNNICQMEESCAGLSHAILKWYLRADSLLTVVSPKYEGADIPMDGLTQCDPRLRQTIDGPELPFKVLGDSTCQFNVLPIIDTRHRTTGYYMMKYHSTNLEQWNVGQSMLDVFIFRCTEALLNYVEVEAELDECTQDVLGLAISRSKDCVETPHLKVNVGFTDPNQSDYGYGLSPLLYEIRREHTIELIGEDSRQDDIARWKAGELLEAPKSMLGMEVPDKLKEQYDSFSQKLTENNLLIVYPDRSTRKWDDKPYLHPLSVDETTTNPNLLPNNPGWE